MKRFNKFSISIIVLAIVFTLGLTMPIKALAATAVNLGTANSFAVLAGSGITNTGSTTITGDIGSYSTATITGDPTVIGTNHAGDEITHGAKTDLATAYTAAAGQACNTNLTGQNLGGLTLTPGVYCFDSSAQLTGTLTLNALNDPNSIFIFKIGSTLTTAGASSISLTNSAKARNIFWQVGSSATLGTTTSFKGTILALTSITLTTGANVEGRMLAQNGAVTLDTNIIIVPTDLHLRKTITTDNGGTAVNTAWTLTATGTGGSPTSLSGTTPVDSGSTFKADTYTLAENGGPSGYTASSWICVGGTQNGSNITVAAGESVTCTINNNDIAPQLHLRKEVNNNHGGAATITDFTLTANGTGSNDISGTSPVNSGAGLLADTFALSETTPDGYTASAWVCVGGTQNGNSITVGINQSATCTITNNDIDPGAPPVPPLISVVKVPNPLSLPDGPGEVTYTFTLNNIGTVPVTDVTMVDDTCTVAFVSGDTNGDLKLDIAETWIYRCTMTPLATHTNTVIAIGWANGLSATEIASATVVVGIPVVPPLIHVTKVPSPLTLPAGGGIVTYTETITNPGTVALSNVGLTDDKCAPVTYVSGDTNSNSKLDTTETWIYTCNMNLIQTTTNTATASGDANDLTASDLAITTVVVAPPSGGPQWYTPLVPPLIDVMKVPNPLSLPDGPGPVEYTYTLRNKGTVPVTNITMVGDTCKPITLISGDINADTKLDVKETWTYTCSTILSETHTNTVVATGWANGLSATDIESATVVVGIPVVPPLIHVTKIPNPLALPAGGGMVTYTKKVTNPGTVALSNIKVTDDKCSSVKYISGDKNRDSKLDTTETWTYTCKMNLTQTTTNTATASGDANGLTAKDFAIATVVVSTSDNSSSSATGSDTSSDTFSANDTSFATAEDTDSSSATTSSVAPGLPNAGFPPEEKSIPWDIIMPAGILILVSISLVVVIKICNQKSYQDEHF